MKILPQNILKSTLGLLTVAGTIATAMPAVKPQTEINTPQTEQCDTFERVASVPPKGTTAKEVLNDAPSPKIKILGEYKTAAIVVDLSANILYKYDENGTPEIAYRVASGKTSTPTHKGLRLVTHIETYPYRGAPKASKRRRAPRDYGPKIICLETLNPKTGEKGITGEFIHGNNNPSSIGKYASHGCIRMDNEIIKELSEQVKRGDIVIIK